MDAIRKILNLLYATKDIHALLLSGRPWMRTELSISQRLPQLLFSCYVLQTSQNSETQLSQLCGIRHTRPQCAPLP